MRNSLILFTLILAGQAFALEATPCPTKAVEEDSPQDGDPNDPCSGSGSATPTSTATPITTWTPTPIITGTPTPCREIRVVDPITGQVTLINDCTGGTTTPTPIVTGTSTPVATSTKTPCPIVNVIVNGILVQQEDCGGNGDPTPTATPDNGGGTATPTATPDNGGGTATPTATPDNGGGTATPTATPDNGGGTSTPTPTPNNGGPTATPTPQATIYILPAGCNLEVPEYDKLALDNVVKGYFDGRGRSRVSDVENVAMRVKGSSSFRKAVNKDRKRSSKLVSSAREAIGSVPGIMIQCDNPPARCQKVEHPGVERFQVEIRKLERLLQQRYKRAINGIQENSNMRALMQKKRAVRYFEKVARVTRQASVNLAQSISKSSYICN